MTPEAWLDNGKRRLAKMENLTKTLCSICDTQMVVTDDGDKYCPVCDKKKKSQEESQWMELFEEPLKKA
jgi:uncharacterized Zn finger protein (UPF0148 family)